jgi:positive regulator of sigma E activity
VSSALIIYVIALVFLILSFVWALITREISATLFAVWAIAIVVVFSGFPWGR